MDPFNISLFLEKVHKYYPIGMPTIYKEYPGFQVLQKLIDQKFDRYNTDKNDPLKNLLNNLEKEFAGYTINSRFYQFPNILIEVELESEKVLELQKKSSAVIVISYLINYYTVYMRDIFIFENFTGKSSSIPPTYMFIYNKSAEKKIFIESTEHLQTIVQRHFPKYEFIDHKLLFDAKITGCGIYSDMNFNIGDYHSIYEFLFDPHSTLDPEVLH